MDMCADLCTGMCAEGATGARQHEKIPSVRPFFALCGIENQFSQRDGKAPFSILSGPTFVAAQKCRPRPGQVTSIKTNALGDEMLLSLGLHHGITWRSKAADADADQVEFVSDFDNSCDPPTLTRQCR